MGPIAKGERAMANKGWTKDDCGSAWKAGSANVTAPDGAIAAADRERCAAGPARQADGRGDGEARQKLRVPLHACIVHFDAEPTSEPPVLDYPEPHA